jgi:hypothetical protein
MLRLLINSLTTLSLLASGLLLWQSDFFPEKMPHGVGGWIAALFGLFHEPYTAMFLYGLTLLVVIGSWFITEILLSLVYSLVAAGLSWICLLGFLSVHYPPIYRYIQALAP